MCISDKELVESIKYSEQAKEYRDSLKDKYVDTDIMKKIYDKELQERRDRLDKMLGIAYRKGKKYMKQEIIDMLAQRRCKFSPRDNLLFSKIICYIEELV